MAKETPIDTTGEVIEAPGFEAGVSRSGILRAQGAVDGSLVVNQAPGATTLTIDMTGVNGLDFLNSFGEIGVDVTMTVGNGQIVGDVNSKAYPSAEGFAYVRMADGTIRAIRLFRLQERSPQNLHGARSESRAFKRKIPGTDEEED